MNPFGNNNESPRGPQSVRSPLTGRALKRAQTAPNREPVLLTRHAKQHNEHLMPSTRAIKRISGSRKTAR